jgi:three-Cys-motif partner protein
MFSGDYMMNPSHRFGGSWTEEKLGRVRQYLSAYTKIFTRNVAASWYKTIYLDAFAGTGYRTSSCEDNVDADFLPHDDDALSFQKGSAYTALETIPAFDQYFFIERSPEYVTELENLLDSFPEKSDIITIVQEEANSFIRHWCRETDWRATRAVVFLDPYGMQVEWKTVEAISHTEAIDLWILFPLGQAVNRLLTKREPPKEAWADRLTTFFGTETWEEAFYRPRKQYTLFGPQDMLEKDTDFESIGKFFVDRLKSVFAGVATNPLPLRNSKNVPIFLLCFAAANTKGAPTAVKIAHNILGK